MNIRGKASIRLPPQVNRILFVRNLPFKVTGQELFDIFGKFGAIRQIRKGDQQKTKGTAFVVYQDLFDAKNAVDHLSGFNVEDQSMETTHPKTTRAVYHSVGSTIFNLTSVQEAQQIQPPMRVLSESPKSSQKMKGLPRIQVKKKVLVSSSSLMSKEPTKQQLLAEIKTKNILKQSEARIQCYSSFSHINNLFYRKSDDQQLEQIIQFEKTPFIADTIRAQRKELVKYNTLLNVVNFQTMKREKLLKRLQDQLNLLSLTESVDPKFVEIIIEKEFKIQDVSQKLKFEEFEAMKLEFMMARTKKSLQYHKQPISKMKTKIKDMNMVLSQIRKLQSSNIKVSDIYHTYTNEVQQNQKNFKESSRNIYNLIFKDFDQINLYKALKNHEKEKIAEENEEKKFEASKKKRLSKELERQKNRREIQQKQKSQTALRELQEQFSKFQLRTNARKITDVNTYYRQIEKRKKELQNQSEAIMEQVQNKEQVLQQLQQKLFYYNQEQNNVFSEQSRKQFEQLVKFQEKEAEKARDKVMNLNKTIAESIISVQKLKKLFVRNDKFQAVLNLQNAIISVRIISQKIDEYNNAIARRESENSVYPSTQDNSIVDFSQIKTNFKVNQVENTPTHEFRKINSSFDSEENYFMKKVYSEKKFNQRINKSIRRKSTAIYSISQQQTRQNFGISRRKGIIATDLNALKNTSIMRLPALVKKKTTISAENILNSQKKKPKSVSQECLGSLEASMTNQAFRPIRQLLQKARNIVENDISSAPRNKIIFKPEHNYRNYM